MTVDADITADILRGMREEMRTEFAKVRAEFAIVHASFAEVKTEIAELRDDIGALQLRMGTVERVVVAFSRELAHLVGRVDTLETRPT
jgi:uncharacterized coiled-coil DUF342 family protein